MRTIKTRILPIVSIIILGLSLYGCKRDYHDNENYLPEPSSAKETINISHEEKQQYKPINTYEDLTVQSVEDNVIEPETVERIVLNPEWEYADYSEIHTGTAYLYKASSNRKDVVIGVNAGHGTKGGQSVKTYCHPDQSPKVTGGTTEKGAIKAVAVSSGMVFLDGTNESDVTLRAAQMLKELLLEEGYDVLMLRDDADVQLDNIARTVIANNVAYCIISLHWDGDNLDYDKGCFYISTPEELKGMEPVASHWQEHERLGEALIEGLQKQGCTIYSNGKMNIDLTQTSYSTIPSVDIELGNAASEHDDATIKNLINGIVIGINVFFQ